MKRRIEISSTTRTAVVAALIAYGEIALGNHINKLYEQADPANDGHEVWILNSHSVML